MKHIKTREVPARTEEVVDYTSCDLCKEKITTEYGSAEEVEVNHRTGYTYSDCGGGETTWVDMCSKCFDEKLIPWLRSQGVEPQTTHWSW